MADTLLIHFYKWHIVVHQIKSIVNLGHVTIGHIQKTLSLFYLKGKGTLENTLNTPLTSRSMAMVAMASARLSHRSHWGHRGISLRRIKQLCAA
jgi:hypothetical protein